MQWTKEIIIIAFIIQLLINQVVKLVLYGSNCPCHGIVDTTWSMTWKKGLNTVAGMPNYWTLKRKDKKDNLSFFNDCFIMFERNGTLFTVMFGIPTVQGQIQFKNKIEPPSPATLREKTCLPAHIPLKFAWNSFPLYFLFLLIFNTAQSISISLNVPRMKKNDELDEF